VGGDGIEPSTDTPLVCKSEPDCPPRFTRCHSVLECPVQRLVQCPPCPRIVGVCFPVLAQTGVWSSGARSHLHGGLALSLPGRAIHLPVDKSLSTTTSAFLAGSGWIAGLCDPLIWTVYKSLARQGRCSVEAPPRRVARIRAVWRSADPRSVAQIEAWSAADGRNRGRGKGDSSCQKQSRPPKQQTSPLLRV